MNTPALAPVLPTPSPSPTAPGASAPRDGEPSAFARELQSATAGSSGEGAGPATSQARETAADDAPADGRGSEAGAHATTARPGQAAGRGTLERWLAMTRAGGNPQPASAAENQAETAIDGELASKLPRAVDDETTATEPPAFSPDPTVRRPDDQPAPEADATQAALLLPPSDERAKVAADTRDGATLPDEGGTVLVSDARPAPAAAQQATMAARQAALRGDDAVAAGPLSGRPANDAAEGRGQAVTGGLRDDATGSTLAAGGATPAAAAPLPGFAAELARAGQVVAGHAGSSPSAGTEVNLPTPVHSADFMPRLSGELAVLARDGVQEARVHVNPAELGPIAVQITLDGSAAQVRLAVEQAQTRDLLEQGMPTLAAALRENGLTLTGGGVFQQARDPGRDGQGAQDPSARGGTSDGRDGGREGSRDALAGAAPVRRVRHPGQVDVYA